jgi:methyl-accepting chemotaxis protein
MTSQPYRSKALKHSRNQSPDPSSLNLSVKPDAIEQPKRSLLQPFYNMPLRGKQLVGLFTSETVSVVGLVGVGSVLIIAGGRSQLLNQAKSELAVSEIGYNIKVDQMSATFQAQASNNTLIEVTRAQVEGRSPSSQQQAQIKALLRNQVEALDIEYATVVGRDLKIIANANANRQGETFNPNELVSAVLENGQQIKTSAVVNWSDLAKENPTLPEGFVEQDALIRYVVTPIIDPTTNTVLGALVSGDVVNGKLPIVQGTVEAFDGGYSAVYARLSNGEFKLATSLDLGAEAQDLPQQNLQLPSSSLLQQAVAASGNPVTQRLVVGDNVYTVAAQSINDNNNQPIAVLVRGTPEVGLNSLLRNSLLLQAVVAILALALDVGLAVLIGEAIGTQIQRLQQTAKAFSSGNRQIRADVLSNDEIGELAKTFNEMADSIVQSENKLSEQANRRALEAQRSRLLAEVTAQIRESLQFTDVLNTAVEGIRDILQGDRVIVYQFTSDFQSGRIVAETGGNTWHKGINRLVLDAVPPETIEQYKAGRIWTVDNLQTADLIEYDAKLLQQFGAIAGMTAPILVGTELVGLLCVMQAYQARSWEEPEIQLFRQLSIQVGVALNQANLLQQQQLSAELARKLNEVTARVRESLEEQRIYSMATEGAQQMLATDRTLIYRLDESGAGTAIVESTAPGRPTAAYLTLTSPYFTQGDVELFERGQVLAIDDIVTTEVPQTRLEQLRALDVRSVLVAPLLVDGKLTGLLCSQGCGEVRQWTEQEVQLFQQLAIQVGFALSQTNLLQQQRISAEFARKLNEITTSMRQSLDEQRIFNTAVDGARQILTTDRTLIYCFDQAGNASAIAESVNERFPVAAYLTLTHPYFDQGDFAKYEQGQVLAIHHIDQAKLSTAKLEQLKSLEVRAVLVAPLLVDGKLMGLLCAQECTAPRQWTEPEIQLLQQLAIQVGYALSQANLLQQQRLSAEYARKLNEITSEMRRSLDQQKIFSAAVDGIRKQLEVDRTLIYLRKQKDIGAIVAESVAAKWAPTLGAVTAYPHLDRDAVEKFQQGQVLAIENINAAGLHQQQLAQLKPFKVVAELVAPVLVDGKLIGLLVAHQCSGTRAWQEAEINFFSRIAIQLGFALEQASLLEKTEEFSKEQKQQKEQLQQQLVELLRDVEGAAQGDLTVRANVTVGEIGTVADFFNAIVESLRQIVTNVKLSAEQVSEAIGENEDSVRMLAEEAIRQAEETHHVLNSVEQMTHSVQSVAESAQQAAIVARSASHTAAEGGAAMDLTVQNILMLRDTIGDTAKKVKRLGEASQQITRVVSLINQIAVQTNLLAINAGIEAARAGEQGQGFAVVAEEVGELATRSASATREIEAIVQQIQSGTNEVVQAMEESTTQVIEGTQLVSNAKQSLGQILEVSRQIDELVQSISEATVSQTQTSQVVTQLLTEVAQVSQHTSQFSLKVSNSLQQAVEVAHELQASVDTFRIDAVEEV